MSRTDYKSISADKNYLDKSLLKMIKPFKLRVPNNTLNKIYKKVKKYPWSNIQNMNSWEYGTNLKYLKEISKYWVTKFNWKKQEKKINEKSFRVLINVKKI